MRRIPSITKFIIGALLLLSLCLPVGSGWKNIYTLIASADSSLPSTSDFTNVNNSSSTDSESLTPTTDELFGGTAVTNTGAASNTGATGSGSTCGESPTEGFGPFTYTGSLVPCGRKCDDLNTDVKENESCTLCHMIVLISNIFKLVMALLMIVTILFITIGGVIYIVSAGRPALKGMAKETITKTLTGFALFFLSWLIVITVLKLLSVKSDVLNSSGLFSFTCDTSSEWNQYDGSGGGSSSSNPTTTPTSSVSSVGCGKVIDAASQMSGWTYSQPNRAGSSSVDCSSLVARSYQAAGCSYPVSYNGTSYPRTTQLYQKAQAIPNTSSLKAGDIIVYTEGDKGHTAICKNDGCSTIIHASQSKGKVLEANSSFMLNGNKNTRVLPASNYCGSSC